MVKGDPRDPLGLRADAPLLDAWLTFTERLSAGTIRPFTIPGHKQRTDLVGDVVRGDDATHTTSPSGTILASIDAVRALRAARGPELIGPLVDLVAAARVRLRAVPGLDTLTGPDVDPTKPVVLLAGTGAHGHAVESDLVDEGFPVEMADRDTLVAMVTLADDESSLAPFAWTTRRPTTVVPPRAAFFATHETVTCAQAAGRISAELIAPYPPGVPVLAPGALVTTEALDALTAARADGGRIAYAADPTLRTLQVVARQVVARQVVPGPSGHRWSG
jgi:arginine decarboxylase